MVEGDDIEITTAALKGSAWSYDLVNRQPCLVSHVLEAEIKAYLEKSSVTTRQAVIIRGEAQSVKRFYTV
jgi:hypothetical protein